MTYSLEKDKIAVIPTYRRVCKFTAFSHLLLLLAFVNNNVFIYSTLSSLTGSNLRSQNILYPGFHKLISPGKRAIANAHFVSLVVTVMFIVVSETWLVILLLCAGDIHPNPGPSSLSVSTSSSSLSSTMSSTIFNSLNTSHNLSFVHYNVQSILSKLEILHAELIEFDVLAFSETWLNASTETDDLLLELYITPVRKDRIGDSHGGL